MVIPVPKHTAVSSPSDANDHLKTQSTSSHHISAHPPVGCDHGGVVADPLDPGGSPRGRVGHRGVGVVVDPLVVTSGIVGKNGPRTCGGCARCYKMSVAVIKPLIEVK